MHLASYNIRGRSSFGVVVGRRHRRSAAAACAAAVSRSSMCCAPDALDEVKAVVAGVRPDFPLAEVETAAAGAGRRENPVHRGELRQPRRRADAAGGNDRGQVSEHVLQAAELASSAQPADPAAAGIRAARIRGRDRAGDRQDRPAHPEGPRAGVGRRHHLCNEGTIRDWIRHGRFNVTQGKSWDATGSIGPWMTTGRRSDQAAAHHLQDQRRGDAGRHHRQHDLQVRRYPVLCLDLHDAEARRHHLHRHADQARPEGRTSGNGSRPATCSR